MSNAASIQLSVLACRREDGGGVDIGGDDEADDDGGVGVCVGGGTGTLTRIGG